MRKITLMTNEAREAKLNNAHEMSDCQNKTGSIITEMSDFTQKKMGKK